MMILFVDFRTSATTRGGRRAARREREFRQYIYTEDHRKRAPPKTGTTSIQDYFSCHQIDQLQQHNITFLGKVNPRDVGNCRGVPKDVVRPMVQYKKGKQIIDALKQQIALGHDVIISDEGLVHVPHLMVEVFQELEASMLPQGTIYRIVPVAAYRRYHQWMVSLYEFANRPQWYTRETWQSWDSLAPPTLSEFFHRRYPAADKHPTAVLVQELQDAVSEGLAKAQKSNATHPMSTDTTSVGHLCAPYILNMHKNQSDVVHEFRTMILRNRGTTIAQSSASKASNVNTGERFVVDSEILALKLKRAGKLHERFQRRAIVTALRSKMERLYHNNTPPLECINATQEGAFLQAATAVEKALLPSEFHSSSMGIEALEKSFEDMSAKKRFCSVAFDEMLEQDESSWKPFLKCLQDGGSECG